MSVLPDSFMRVAPPKVSNTEVLSGVITITAAGTEESGPAVTSQVGFLLTPHPDNTGAVFIMGSTQDVTTAFKLPADQAILLPVANLSQVKFDAEVSGEKITYLRM